MIVIANPVYWFCDQCRADSRITQDGMWSVNFRTYEALCPQCARADTLEEAALAVCRLCRDAPSHDNVNPAEFLQVYNWRPQWVHFCISDDGEEMWTDCEANAIRALKDQDDGPGT